MYDNGVASYLSTAHLASRVLSKSEMESLQSMPPSQPHLPAPHHHHHLHYPTQQQQQPTAMHNNSPPALLSHQSRACYHLNAFYHERVLGRKANISKTIREVVKIAQDVLKEVELQEPRFISTLKGDNNHYEGLRVVSPTEFEVILYLNQMGVFNFVDDGTIPGCAVLKLSDGRKRSMSLWVEFITASGYLSARKIRSRFQTLVAQAIEKSAYRDIVKLLTDTSEVRLRLRERYTVQITPAFRCGSIWPRSASHWPPGGTPHWPSVGLVAEVKTEGFNLLSKESVYMKDKQSSAEGDAFSLDFNDAEERLMFGGCRRRCLSILKALVCCDAYLDTAAAESSTNMSAARSDASPQSPFGPPRGGGDFPVHNYHLKTLILFECEKHPHESEWDEVCLPDRINGVLLQLISCLQNRRCPHYFLVQLDLFRGRSPASMDAAAKHVWNLLRDLLTNPKALERFS